MRRQCTREFKITPIDVALRSWLTSVGLGYVDSINRNYVKRGVELNFHLGISIDESRRVSPSRTKWKIHKYPLIEIGFTRNDCVNFAIANGYPIPPKSSCIFCPYHTDDYWASLTASELNHAIKLDDYVRTDAFKRKIKSLHGEMFIHSSCRPLRDIAREGFKKKEKFPVQLSFASELLEHSCSNDGGFSCFS